LVAAEPHRVLAHERQPAAAQEGYRGKDEHRDDGYGPHALGQLLDAVMGCEPVRSEDERGDHAGDDAGVGQRREQEDAPLARVPDPL
jgi:hypothetical protein